MQIKLAWRNLWRNKRRTLITVAAIFFSVVLSVVMSSFQQGTWSQIIGSVVEQYSGYGQIHHKGYWDEQTLNNSMEYLPLDSIPNRPHNLIQLVPRLESFALGSHGRSAQGVQIIGIDPHKEDSLTNLADKVSEGTYLTQNEPGILLGEGYARIMEMGVGDTLVLLGQGYHGVTAVGQYEVKGLLNFGNPELSSRLAYLPLKEAQYVFGMEGRVTAMVMQFDNNYRFERTIKEVRGSMDTSRFEVMNWKEMNPSLVQAVQADTGGMVIMLLIIYMVIGFGIFSTVIMMTAERNHEFGILLAIGMKRWRMQVMMFFETLFLALIGILAGLIATLPLMAYFGNNPIQLQGKMAEMYEDYGFEAVIAFSTEPQVFLSQAAIILAIILAVYFYPFNKIRKMDSVDAMHG